MPLFDPSQTLAEVNRNEELYISKKLQVTTANLYIYTTNSAYI